MKRRLKIFAVLSVSLLCPADLFCAAALVKVTIDIKDMTCPLCVTSINRALRKTEGVVKAKASLKTKQAEVIVPEDFPVKKLLDAISVTGYTGKIIRIEKQITEL